MRAKQYLGLLKQAAFSWSSDYAPSMGAALSYYTLFSIAPLLLIVIAVAGFVFGADAARGAIFEQLDSLIGTQGAKAVEGLLQAADEPREGMLSSIIGVLVLLIGATTVFGELQNALDRIWRAPAREQSSSWWNLIRTRLLSFGMILGIAFLLMVSLVISAMLSALGKLWTFEGWEALAHALDIVVSFGLITVLFALIYKMIPRAEVGWRDVWIGAAVTSLLFAVGKFLIGLYLGKSAVASSFGAAGSLVVLIVWVYYSAQIFLFGAEFTWVYAHELGSRRGRPRPGTETPKVEAKPGAEPQPALRASPGFQEIAPSPRTHPVALLVGALAAGAVLGLARASIAEALRRRSPFLSRRRRIFAALGR